MTVLAIVANRTETRVNLYWPPDSTQGIKGYKLYTSLEKDSGYSLGVSYIHNIPAPSGRVSSSVKGFIKPGSISTTLNLNSLNIPCDQEFFVKVTSINKEGVECPIDAVPFTYVRLTGNNHTNVQNINTDSEKGVVAWEEDNNTFRRINATAQRNSIEAKYSLDVNVVDSKISVENKVDSSGNTIPLSVGGMLSPNLPDLQRTLDIQDVSASELYTMVGSPVPGFPFKVHSVVIQSDIPVDCEVYLKLRIESGEDFILDLSSMKSSSGDISYFFSSEEGLLLTSTDLLVIETANISGQGATLKVTALVSALNKG